MCAIKRGERLRQARIHFVRGRASFFADQRMPGLPIWPYTSIWGQSGSKLWTILQLILTLPSWSYGRPSMELRLRKTDQFFFSSPVRNICPRIFLHNHIKWPRDWLFFARSCSHPSINNVCVSFAFTLSASQIHVVKEWCWFSKINQLHIFHPHVTQILFFFAFLCHPRIPTRISHVFDEQKTFPIRYFLPYQFHWNFFKLSLPQGACQWVTT